jgi:hypothetical protein
MAPFSGSSLQPQPALICKDPVELDVRRRQLFEFQMRLNPEELFVYDSKVKFYESKVETLLQTYSLQDLAMAAYRKYNKVPEDWEGFLINNKKLGESWEMASLRLKIAGKVGATPNAWAKSRKPHVASTELHDDHGEPIKLPEVSPQRARGKKAGGQRKKPAKSSLRTNEIRFVTQEAAIGKVRRLRLEEERAIHAAKLRPGVVPLTLQKQGCDVEDTEKALHDLQCRIHRAATDRCHKQAQIKAHMNSVADRYDFFCPEFTKRTKGRKVHQV